MPIAQKRLVAAGRWSLAAAAAVTLSSVAIPKAVRADVSAVAWGLNRDGELGNGVNYYTPIYNYNVNNPTPGTVTGLTSGVTAVTVGNDSGSSYGLALVNGGLVAWGYDADGELGNGVDINPAQPSYRDQTYNTPVAVNGMSSGVTAVAAAGGHTLAIQNGAVYAWGGDTANQLGNASVTGGESDSPVPVTGLSSGVTAIAGGGDFSLAIKVDSMGNAGVYAWGDDYAGALGNGTSGFNAFGAGVYSSVTPTASLGLTTGVTAIAAGQSYGLAIKNGAVYAWGSGSGGLGNGTTFSNTPVLVSSSAAFTNANVTAIAAGGYHILALQNGSVYAWGSNGSGQLGNGTTNASATPVAVIGITGTITQIAASASDSYALSADGSIWDWGANNYGQLGLGTTGSSKSTPQHLLAPLGYAYTSVASNSGADNVVTTLAHPNAVVAASAVGTSLGTASAATPTLVLSGPTISGSVQIGAGLSNTVYLTLDNTTQGTALVTDLNNVYGTGTASNVSGGSLVALTLPTSGNYFNFDFTTVVNAGVGGNTVGSVAIDDIGFAAAPEPASLGLLTAAVAGGLFGRRRRRARA